MRTRPPSTWRLPTRRFSSTIGIASSPSLVGLASGSPAAGRGGRAARVAGPALAPPSRLALVHVEGAVALGNLRHAVDLPFLGRHGERDAAAAHALGIGVAVLVRQEQVAERGPEPALVLSVIVGRGGAGARVAGAFPPPAACGWQPRPMPAWTSASIASCASERLSKCIRIVCWAMGKLFSSDGNEELRNASSSRVVLAVGAAGAHDRGGAASREDRCEGDLKLRAP